MLEFRLKSQALLVVRIMKKKRLFIFIVAILVIGIIGFLVINGFGKVKLASLEVDSNVNLAVLVDGQSVGTTPYTGTFPVKQITVTVGSYETRVNLTPGVKTVVKRNFSEDLKNSSGMIASFEKNDSSGSTLAVVTNPDGAIINFDGIAQGPAPININSADGDHKLEVSALGYETSDLSVNLVNGYKLIAVVDLAPSVTKPTPSLNSQTISSLNEVLVQILSTPTGFLRVRQEPNIASTEVGQVHPGEKYKFLSQDNQSGWYDIQLTASSSGWISNTYAATVSATVKE